jgi:hypothetical protein
MSDDPAPPENRFDSVPRAELSEGLTLQIVDPPESYTHSIPNLLVWESLSQILHELVLPIAQGLVTQPTLPRIRAARFQFSNFQPPVWDAER